MEAFISRVTSVADHLYFFHTSLTINKPPKLPNGHVKNKKHHRLLVTYAAKIVTDRTNIIGKKQSCVLALISFNVLYSIVAKQIIYRLINRNEVTNSIPRMAVCLIQNVCWHTKDTLGTDKFSLQ